MADKLKIQIPFSGFYNSSHEGIFDSELEYELDNLAQEYGADNDVCIAYSEAFNDAIQWRKVFTDYAREYVEAFNDVVECETGLKLALEFDELTSPREYNFETDKIFAFISPESVNDLFEIVTKENLQKIISERHTSRSGFISFYSNDLKEWPENVLEWDEIQLESLLRAYLFQIIGDDWGRYFEAWELMEDMRCTGGASSMLWNSMTVEDCAYINALDSAIRDNDAEGFNLLVAKHNEKKIPLKGTIAKLGS